jgi:hypothetical protein
MVGKEAVKGNDILGGLGKCKVANFAYLFLQVILLNTWRCEGARSIIDLKIL